MVREDQQYLVFKGNLIQVTQLSPISLFGQLSKSRNITLQTKMPIVKAMVFPVVMYGCELWTMEKAEHRRIDAFELWC